MALTNKDNRTNTENLINTHTEEGEDEVTVVPAVVVVCVLATPIVLVFIALLIQHVRMKGRVRRAAQKRSLNSSSNSKSSCCCCVSPKYYYDSERGFDRLVKGYKDGDKMGGDDFSSDDEEEEDLFTRKA